MDNEQAPLVGRVRDFLSKFDSDEDNNQIKKGMLSNPSTPNSKRKLVSNLVGQLEKSSSEPNVDNPTEGKVKGAKSDNPINEKEEKRVRFFFWFVYIVYFQLDLFFIASVFRFI
jgi:hypothetical protein